MRRIGRWMLNALTALSLVLCVAVLVIGAKIEPVSVLISPNGSPYRPIRGAELWGHFFPSGTAGYELTRFLYGLKWFVIFVLIAVPAYKVRSFREKRRRELQGCCPMCSYDLTGNVSGVCPECGTKIAEAK